MIVRAVLVLVALGVWAYAVIDIIRTPRAAARLLPKALWLLAGVVVPVLGGACWLLFGHPWPEGSLLGTPREETKPPDDSPEFLADLEEQIRRRKRTEELRRSGQIDPNLRESLDEEIARLEEQLKRSGEDDGDEDDEV